MKLFDINGGKVVIHPDALGLPFFKKLWEADKPDTSYKCNKLYSTYVVF
jgi:hypothetical protein